MKNRIILILTASFFFCSIGQSQEKKIKATAAATGALKVKRPTKNSVSKFIYVNGLYTSFADEVQAQVAGQRTKARTVFSAFAVGFDYTMYLNRYLYGWTLNVLTGNVDIAKTLNVSYPRRSFLGVQTGPELGYRINADMDLSYGLGLLYRDINSVGGSFVISNQINVKFRLTPRLTFFQNFGNYGKPKSYSYSVGMRWLL